MPSLTRHISALLGVLCATGALVACSAARWQETGPVRSGSGAPIAPQNIRPNQQLFIDQPRILPSGTLAIQRPTCVLDGDESVRVIIAPRPGESTVEVEPSSQAARNACGRSIEIPYKALAQTESIWSAQRRYFAVLNVASQKLRVYERCAASNCSAHRLILETSMAAGPNLPGRRTWLGEYSITGWYKFYADNAGHYPPFYAPNAPPLPHSSAALEQWLSPALLADGKGEQRGAFGWFTAHLNDSDGQWLQGTWGWGADGNRLLRDVREGHFARGLDPYSHGCVRVDNPTIAFLRQILPVGATVMRVYAREELHDPAKISATDGPAWKWILTKAGVNSDSASGADARTAANASAAPSERLDSGVYRVNQTATAAGGNPYTIPAAKIHGVFYPDRGTFEGYAHPEGLTVGGHRERVMPAFMAGSSRSFRN